MSESERMTIDFIPLKPQFERLCVLYQDMKNQVDLLERRKSEWKDQYEILEKTGSPEEKLKFLDACHEIRNSYDKAIGSRDIYASMLADFVFENKDRLATALELADKKRELPIKSNHVRRGR